MIKKIIQGVWLPLCMLCLLLAQGVAANTVEKVLQESEGAISDGQQSQKRVETIAIQTQDLIGDFRQASKVNEDLGVYNKKLEIQVAKQQEQLAQLSQSMDNVNDIQARMLPLAIKMIESLDRFIELDLPFLTKERKNRIQQLRNSVDRPELSVAEKFRQVLEAYKIENEYGRKIRTYQESINLAGKKRDVNVLQVGRVALLYQTTDGKETGVWDKQKKSWVKVDGEYRSTVQKGIRIAKKQASIDILSLPIPAAEVFKP